MSVCPICGVAGQGCGDDHVAPGSLITSATIKGETAMSEGEPLEMKEYEYYVGHIPTTAMLTEEMAERLDAKPVGSAKAPKEGDVGNNEAQRASTHGSEAGERGVNATYPDGTTGADAAEKTRTARNKRAG